jgi:fructokinase
LTSSAESLAHPNPVYRDGIVFARRVRAKAITALIASPSARNDGARFGMVRAWRPRDRSTMIVCAGEALIDLVPLAEPAGAHAFRAIVGGSPPNVAVALGRLGVSTAFLGAVSTDAFGDRIVAALGESGVDLSLVARVDRPTQRAIVGLNGDEPHYTFYDTATAARGMTLRELKALPADAAVLHFGSIALAAEPAASTLIARAKTAREGRLICVDPNVRPAFAHDKPFYRRNLERAMELGHIVKLSLSDLAWLCPQLTAEEFARQRLAGGALLVVVTRGSQGAIACTRAGTSVAAAAAVPVVDTIGAGDAFTAGLLAALMDEGIKTPADLESMRPQRLGTALAFATTVAGATCTRAGADPPRKGELAGWPGHP